jgi:hypothetical protein
MSLVGTDRFKVIGLLGSGSMGTVYLVFDRQLGAEAELKVLDAWDGMRHPSTPGNPERDR